MAAPQISPDVLSKFRAVNEKNYADQAIFYLNAFWSEGAEAEAENVWTLAELFGKEDHVKGKNGNELNPIQAFNLLQKQNKTMTALELKALLRKVDYDNNGDLSLAEYLVGFNNRDPIKFVNNPQGEVDKVKLAALEERFAQLDTQLQNLLLAQKDAEDKADAASAAKKAAEEQEEAAKVSAEDAKQKAEAALVAQKKAEDEEAKAKAAEQVALDQEAQAKSAAEDAKQKADAALAAQQNAEAEEAAAVAAENNAKEEEAIAAAAEAKALEATNKLKAVEDELRAVEDEARAIADEIKKEEDSKAAEIARLEALSTDQTVGIVKRNMAVQQLAAAKGEDPLPLRKAKLTQEAVVRRLAKVTKAAADETAIAKVVSDEATAKREIATQAANAAESARKAANAAKDAAVAAREAADAAKAKADAEYALAQEKRAEAVAAREQAVASREAAVAAREAADAAKVKADQQYELAQQKRAEAVAAKQAADEAVVEVKRQLKETEEALAQCEVELAELRAQPSQPMGLLWWQDRILQDKKRSLPQRMW